MGFLGRLFKKDPAELVDRAGAALDRGEAVEALGHLARLPGELEPSLRKRADGLTRRAHDAIASRAEASAADLAEGGLLEQALDRLELALEHAGSDERRTALAERRDALKARLAGDDEEDDQEDDADGEVEELGLDGSYEMLVGMLSEEVAALYEDRPESFRRAYVDLHEGRAAEALPAFDALLDESPDDAAARFERGHCLLVLGRPGDARTDLEAAWEALGDGHLDTAGSLSVPLVWADAALDLQDHVAVVDRLADLGAPERGDAALSHRLAVARAALEQTDLLVDHLEGCVKAFPRVPDFPYQLAAVLAQRGERVRAIDVLETAIAPSCASGSCGGPALHVPSLRELAGLYLEEGGALPRVRELTQFIAGAQRGKLEWVDHALVARLLRDEGDDAGFRGALGKARAELPEDAAEARRALDALEGAAS